MKIKQISLFLENKPGRVAGACRILADAGINIETMSLADTEQFGILRLIVQDWKKAVQVFEQHGIVVKLTDVIALQVPNKPGGLADLLGLLDQAQLNIEYTYTIFCGKQETSTLIFRFNDSETAIQTLQQGVRLVDAEELFAAQGAAANH
ncbi:MAG: ACT domain-containing protein [Planctomycetaceae bacterium]|nr:ACT domain-containing protein [Planctomycetaceae bacterium]